MNQIESLLAQYKPKISPGLKSAEVLQQSLKRCLDIERIPLTVFSESFIQHLYYNALHAITNKDAQLTSDEFSFIAYKLLRSEKNKEYIANINEHGGTGEKFIYVIFEEKTGYVLVNNGKLHLEITIEFGVSQYDYDNNTERLLHYIGCVERLAKKEY
ncbi:MAG: hypothetical protein LBR98_01265 [Syntrophomonadaceae bacterium]|jgi:hypothetical protein|nr:hypothetical protein [Syntrophomonadaceae bacterium]